MFKKIMIISTILMFALCFNVTACDYESSGIAKDQTKVTQYNGVGNGMERNCGSDWAGALGENESMAKHNGLAEGVNPTASGFSLTCGNSNIDYKINNTINGKMAKANAITQNKSIAYNNTTATGEDQNQENLTQVGGNGNVAHSTGVNLTTNTGFSTAITNGSGSFAYNGKKITEAKPSMTIGGGITTTCGIVHVTKTSAQAISMAGSTANVKTKFLPGCGG